MVNILTTPFTVDDLTVPEEFEELIADTLEKIKALSNRIDDKAYKELTIFVDPIDGTREFATGKGDKVTILVGYNDMAGVPQAGIIYRPLTTPKYWASGAKSEGFKDGVLDIPDELVCCNLFCIRFLLLVHVWELFDCVFFLIAATVDGLDGIPVSCWMSIPHNTYCVLIGVC